ncbi:hypothetical protein D3C83_61440 [compost metagenome]
MLAASIVGMTSRFASPRMRECGNTLWRISSESAVSPCISPSTSRSGARSLRIASACCIFLAEGRSTEPKFEADSSATLGTMPKRRISSAARIVISATCAASGSGVT